MANAVSPFELIEDDALDLVMKYLTALGFLDPLENVAPVSRRFHGRVTARVNELVPYQHDSLVLRRGMSSVLDVYDTACAWYAMHVATSRDYSSFRAAMDLRVRFYEDRCRIIGLPFDRRIVDPLHPPWAKELVYVCLCRVAEDTRVTTGILGASGELVSICCLQLQEGACARCWPLSAFDCAHTAACHSSWDTGRVLFRDYPEGPRSRESLVRNALEDGICEVPHRAAVSLLFLRRRVSPTV